ncbi:MAG TPA: hypothetical protein PLP19_01225 [bacterium]|nr:hypothetical protein [bacterium]HPN42085.1 hypothetical protein [bacterium]
MTEKKRSFIPGLVIILLGIVLLLHNLHIISQLEEFIGGLFFLTIAYFCLQVVKRNPRHVWSLLVGIFCFIFGIALLCKAINLLRGDLIGAAFFWGIAVALSYIYYRDQQKWWSIIPAGTCVTLGAIALLDALDITPADYNGVVFFLGMGLTFVFLWTLANDANKLKWARFPAISCLLLSLYIYIDQVITIGIDSLAAGLLILAGVFIVFRACKRR